MSSSIRALLARAAVIAVATLGLSAAGAPRARAEDDPAKLVEEGRVRLEAGDVETAVKVLRRARDLAPDDADVGEALGAALVHLASEELERREVEAARRHAEEAVRLVPKRWDAHAVLGIARFREQAWEGSARSLQRAVENGGGDRPRVLTWLGHALYRMNDNAGAIARWEKARALVAAKADDDDEAAAALLGEIDAALEKVRREEKVEGGFEEGLSNHFRLKWDGGGEDPALGATVLSLLEDAWNTVGYDIGRYPEGEVPVVVYGEREFRGAVGAHGWVAGLYDGKIRIPVRGLASADPASLRAVVTHEFTHALLHAAGGGRVPIWFQEGLAQKQEGRAVAESEAVLRERRREGWSLPAVADLEKAFVKVRERERVEVLYAVSHLLVEELLATSGATALTDYLDALAAGIETGPAFQKAFGTTLADFHRDFVGRR